MLHTHTDLLPTCLLHLQPQPHVATVQRSIEAALCVLLQVPREKLGVMSAGRTDSGVHAKGQVCRLGRRRVEQKDRQWGTAKGEVRSRNVYKCCALSPGLKCFRCAGVCRVSSLALWGSTRHNRLLRPDVHQTAGCSVLRRQAFGYEQNTPQDELLVASRCGPGCAVQTYDVCLRLHKFMPESPGPCSCACLPCVHSSFASCACWRP